MDVERAESDRRLTDKAIPKQREKNVKKKLLAACNNRQDAEGLEAVFRNLEEIELLPSVFDGMAAMDTILTRDVDLLLLDLFLPERDGLQVLDFIARLGDDRKPIVFLMTALPDDRLLIRVKDQVVYCFIKPLHYETVQLRVLEMMHTAEMLDRPSNAVNDDMLERQIAAGIRAIGVPAHLKGYYYLRDGIRIYALCENRTEISVMRDIYPTVAKLYGTRPPLVEHAMRNAIEIAWTRGNLQAIHDYFGYTVNDFKGKPSNMEFIAMMAERALTYVKKR